MARTVEDIYSAMNADKDARPELAGLNNSSTTARYKLWMYIVSVCCWALENLFDIHIVETRNILANEKPGRIRWYVEMAKKFQYGRSLVDDQDYYDNTGVDESTLEAEQIVKYAACMDSGNSLRVKVAGVSGGALAPLTTPQILAFQNYMMQIKYAGVNLSFTNSIPDALKLDVTIYYDPLVLNANGERLDGSNNTPVQSAIDEYLISGIDFNGFFISAALTDSLQSVDGVEIPALTLVQYRYGLLPWMNVINMVRPDAGYLRISPADLSLTFIPSPL